MNQRDDVALVFGFLRKLLAERRAGRPNGVVSAAKTRAKLRRLSMAGVGYKTAANAAGVSKTIAFGIMTGRRLRCRQATERAILGVQARWALRPRAYVDARATWTRIEKILAFGGKKAWIAKALGCKQGALQLRPDRITKQNADKVLALYNRVFSS